MTSETMMRQTLSGNENGADSPVVRRRRLGWGAAARCCTAASLAWTLALGGTTALGDPIVTLLSVESSEPTWIGSNNSRVQRPVASRFTVGSSGILLDEVLLALGNPFFPQTTEATATIAIYSEASDLPDALVAGSQVSLAYTGQLSTRSFTFNAPVALDPDTSYWLVLDQPTGDLFTYSANLTEGTTTVTETYATAGAPYVYKNDGSEWIENSLAGSSLVYELRGSAAVPEASTFVFLGMCTASGACAVIWRRRNQAAARV